MLRLLLVDDDKAIALSGKSRGAHVERWFKALQQCLAQKPSAPPNPRPNI